MAIEMWRPRRGLARRGIEPFRAFDDWLSPRLAGEARGWSPAVDMIDKKDEIVLRADLPGLEQKDIKVNVENGTLTTFSRSMTLPPGTDQDKIKATFKNGVLEVHVPKSPQAVGKSIEVRAA